MALLPVGRSSTMPHRHRSACIHYRGPFETCKYWLFVCAINRDKAVFFHGIPQIGGDIALLAAATPPAVIVPHPANKTEHFAPPTATGLPPPSCASTTAPRKMSSWIAVCRQADAQQSPHCQGVGECRKRPSAPCRPSRPDQQPQRPQSGTSLALARRRDQYFFHYFTARGRKE